MRTLLIVTALLEVGAGLVLLVWPSAMAEILVGSALDSPAALTVGRVGGAALLSLGVACWLARHDGQSQAASALVAGMFLYNTAATAVLAYAGIGLALFGVALWPAVVIHAAMAVWCGVCFWLRPSAAVRSG